MSGEPTDIRTVVVHADDVVSALAADERRPRATVLRVTPPFSGRMRARIHRVAEEGTDDESVHIDPADLVDASPPPTPDETEDELRASEERYTPERHREYHQRAVERWRDRARGRIVESVELVTGHRVEVGVLGND